MIRGYGKTELSTCDNSMASKLLRVKLPSNLMEFYRHVYSTSTLQTYAKGVWLYRYHNSWNGTNRLLAIGICQKYGVPFDTTR